MPKHTEAEMEKLPFEELKAHAIAEAAEPERKETAAPVVEEPEEVVEEQPASLYRRVIDLGGGAGPEVFEAESLEELVDKIAEAKEHATKKIREQEAELRELRAKTAEPPKPKTLSADDEYVISQEMQKSPVATTRKIFKELTGYEIEDFKDVKQAVDAVKTAQQTNQAITTFIASHPDYEDDGAVGKRNGDLMRMKLAELGLPATSENLSKAYLHLKQSGLLTLKGEEANAVTDGKAKEPARIEQPKEEPTQQRTKKVSGISTHNRTANVPVSTEPSEDEAYSMPLDKLRGLANKQLAGSHG